MPFSNLINATPTSSSIPLFDFLDSLKKKTAIDLTTNQTLTKPNQYTKQFFSKREMMALQTNHQKAESREKKVPTLLFPFAFLHHTKSLSLSLPWHSHCGSLIPNTWKRERHTESDHNNGFPKSQNSTNTLLLIKKKTTNNFSTYLILFLLYSSSLLNLLKQIIDICSSR